MSIYQVRRYDGRWAIMDIFRNECVRTFRTRDEARAAIRDMNPIREVSHEEIKNAV